MSMNVDCMIEPEFNNHVLTQLYASLNKFRESLNLPKLFQDDAAENAIKDYLIPEIRQTTTFDNLLKQKEFCGKVTLNLEHSKNYPPKENEIKYSEKFSNYMHFFEEQFASQNSTLSNQDCSTHVGIGSTLDFNNNYTIVVVLSQKGISIESGVSLKDGMVIQGQMLQPNSYLCGIVLVKNRKMAPLIAGPSRINFDKNTGKFNIVLASKQYGSPAALGMRKVSFHCKQTNNPNEIPYLDEKCNDKDFGWQSYEVLLVQTINFLKFEDKRKDSIEKFLKPFEDSNSDNNNNVANNTNVNLQQQNNNNNNLNNLIGNVNVSPINNNTGNNLAGNQNVNMNINDNNVMNIGMNNNNQISNIKNNQGNLLNSTNSKNQTNSFFNPNFMNNKKPGNTGINMFGPIKEENSFMIGSMCNSNLNSLRKLNNNLVHLSNSKTNPMMNNNMNNLNTANQALMNNLNNNLLNSNQLNKNQNMNDLNINQNTQFQMGTQSNQNNTNMNVNSLQNNIRNINMNSLNNFNNTPNNNSNNNLNFNNQNNNNNGNNLVRNSLNQNPLNNQGNNNLFNSSNSNNMQINNNLNAMGVNNNNLGNNLNQNFQANNQNNNGMGMNNNPNNINGFNQNPNQFASMNNNQQQQNFNLMNNPNQMQIQMHPNNNMNMDIMNNQRQGSLMNNNNNNIHPFAGNNNMNSNFSFNNNSNVMHPNMMNCNNTTMSNQNFHRNYPSTKTPLDFLFPQITYYENLFRKENHIIKAYNIPHGRFAPNATISEMLNSLPNEKDDVMHIPIKNTLATGYNKLVILLDPFKAHNSDNNLKIIAKSRMAFAEFIECRMNEKKNRIINNVNNEHQPNENNNFGNVNERNNFNANSTNNYNSAMTNPFNLFDKNNVGNNNVNNNLNISMQNQQQFNLRNGENDSINRMHAGNFANPNINNNINKGHYYLENPSGRMFNNPHPNLLKSSGKFYIRERNAIEEYYANSSLDRLFNCDYNNNNNILIPERENDRANLNNLHNPNSNNNGNNYKFQINKEEYQKLSKSLLSNDSSNNLYPNNIKDISNNTNKNISSNNNHQKEGRINLEQLEKEYLHESDLKKEPNPVFVHLYKKQTDFDLIMDINGERINAHKIVVLTQCNSIEKVSQQVLNSGLNRGNYNEPIFIHLNKKFKKEIIMELLKWLYCRKISSEVSNDIMSLRQMLFIAQEFEIFDLQRILIVKYVLPAITKECCLRFLKDSHNKNVQPEVREVWKLLGQYSLITSGKNFSYLLKHGRNQILGMETDLLFTVIEEAIYFASEFSEVQNMIELVIEYGFANDVFELLGNLSKYYDNARNFHIQSIDIKSTLEKIDFLKPNELPLLNDARVYAEKFSDLKTINNSNSTFNNGNGDSNGKIINNLNTIKTEKNSDSNTEKFANPNEINNVNSNNLNNQINKNHISTKNDNSDKNLELAKSKNEFHNLLNSFRNDKLNCPSYNKVNPAHENLRKKNPNFIFRLNLSEDLLESCSIISDAFNTKSNSWQLKIDIQKETGEVSIFLLERGLPVLPQKCMVELKKRNTVKFTSVLFEIEVRDNTFEKSFLMFFSYLLNQNQIIGFENFFNLNQLDKKEQIYINVWIKEYALHSACLQYISNNFQNLANNSNQNNTSNNNNLNNENKQNELNRNISQVNLNISEMNKNNNNNYNQNNYTLNKTFNNGNGAVRSLFDVSIGDLAYILFNDHLAVENENLVISFIYKYCLKRNPKEIECLMNTIRYKFVDFRMLCIITRDHKVISKSGVFQKFFDYELKSRIGKRVDYSLEEDPKKNEPSSQDVVKKSYSLGGQDNYLNISLPNKINSDKNPFAYAKEDQISNKLINNNKKNVLFSDFKESGTITNKKNEQPQNIIENSQINNDLMKINLKKIEFIQSKPRLSYKTFKPNHPIEAELKNFFFESDHHSGYESELERIKKLFEESAKAKEREIKMLQNQKKELEAEIQKMNEREMRRRRANNNNNANVSGSIFNKSQNEQNPKCLIF